MVVNYRGKKFYNIGPRWPFKANYKAAKSEEVIDK